MDYSYWFRAGVVSSIRTRTDGKEQIDKKLERGKLPAAQESRQVDRAADGLMDRRTRKERMNRATL